MSTIDRAFVRQFGTTLRSLSQQQGSRLRNTVMEEPLVGSDAYFERLGAFASTTITNRGAARHGATPLNNSPHSRRQVTPVDIEWGEVIDNEDKVRMLIDPTSKYMQHAAWELGRQWDSQIIAAASGNALDVAADLTTSAVALPAGQTIAVDFEVALTNTNLTLQKVIEAGRILDSVDAPQEGRYFIYGSSQKAAVLNISQFTSADFRTIAALERGDPAGLMGFTWIRSERLAVSLSIRTCLAYQQMAIGVKVNESMFTQIERDPTRRYSFVPYARETMGATRVEDELVVEILCDETA